MKKIFSALLVTAALFVAAPSQAQSFSFGAKGGLNITDVSLDNSKNAISSAKDNKNGWFVGPTIKLSLPMGLGFDLAAFYDQRESEIEGETVKQQSINIPLNVRYNIGLGSIAGIYVAAGPQFGFNLGDTDFSWGSILDDAQKAALSTATGETVSSSTLDEAKNTFQLKKSAFSVNVGAGVTLLKHIEVGVTYNIAIGKTGDLSTDYSDLLQGANSVYNETRKSHVHAWQIHAAYYF